MSLELFVRVSLSVGLIIHITLTLDSIALGLVLGLIALAIELLTIVVRDLAEKVNAIIQIIKHDGQ